MMRGPRLVPARRRWGGDTIRFAASLGAPTDLDGPNFGPFI